MGVPTRRFHAPSALRRSPARIEPEEAQALTDAGALLIDVRREDDPSASLLGAVRVTPDTIPRYVETLERDVPIVLACT